MSLKSIYYKSMNEKYNLYINTQGVSPLELEHEASIISDEIKNEILNKISNSKLLKKYIYINIEYYFDNYEEYLDNLLNQIFVKNNEFEGLDWEVININNNPIIKIKMF